MSQCGSPRGGRISQCRSPRGGRELRSFTLGGNDDRCSGGFCHISGFEGPSRTCGHEVRLIVGSVEQLSSDV